MQPTIRSHQSFITTNYAKIWYQICDTATSQNQIPIICINGGPGLTHDSLLTLKTLANNHPVIFYDQSGCGKTTTKNPDFNNWTLDYFTNELESFIAALGYKQVHIIGHSWGGMLAVQYALKNPTKIASLILIGPCLSSSMWIDDCKKLAESVSPKLYNTMLIHETNQTTDSSEYAEAINEFYSNFFCRTLPWPKDLENAMSLINRKIYETMWGCSETSATGNLKDIDLVPNLHLINHPTLFICGQYDPATPESMHFCASKMKNAKVTVIENCAHCVPFEKPTELITAINTFYINLNS